MCSYAQEFPIPIVPKIHPRPDTVLGYKVPLNVPNLSCANSLFGARYATWYLGDVLVGIFHPDVLRYLRRLLYVRFRFSTKASGKSSLYLGYDISVFQDTKASVRSSWNYVCIMAPRPAFEPLLFQQGEIAPASRVDEVCQICWYRAGVCMYLLKYLFQRLERT